VDPFIVKAQIVIESYHLFQATVSVEMPGVGKEKGVNVSVLSVSMEAHPYVWSSAGIESADAMRWVKWLFDMLERQNSHLTILDP
jgi:hypothetical protein